MIIPAANRLGGVNEYYFVKKLEEIARLNQAGRDIISFAIGSPDMAPSEQSLDAMRETLLNPKAHGYQPYRGVPALRQAMAKWYAHTYHVSLDPDKEILPLMGSKEGIMHVSMAFLNPGDKALVPNPGYPAYAAITQMIGAVPVYYTLEEQYDWHPHPDQLNQLNLDGVKIMWVNYPHMPTGTPPHKGHLQALVKWAAEKKILLVFDNPYSLVLQEGAPFSVFQLEGAKGLALELNSLSKSHNLAGWRVGMLSGEADYLTAALAIKSNMDSGMFLGIQNAAIASFSNSDEWHVERNETYKRRRDLIYQILEVMGCTYAPNQVGLFVWAKPAEPYRANVEAYCDSLLHEAGVFFTPGSVFGSSGKGYLRASLCVPEGRIAEALERVKKHNS
jgi:LL-diaminopimelate aminotransferase